VLDPDLHSEIFVRLNFSSVLTLGIDDEGQLDFVVGSELFREGAQVLRRDLGLVLENVVTVFVAEFLLVRVEIPSVDRRIH
jgi:hypothetical protein